MAPPLKQKQQQQQQKQQQKMHDQQQRQQQQTQEQQQKQQPPAYRLVALDELGVLRVVDVPAGPNWAAAELAHKWGEPSKERGATCLACSSSSSSSSSCSGGSSSAGNEQEAAAAPALLAVGRKGRAVDVVDGLTGAVVASLQLPAPAAAVAGGSGGGRPASAPAAAAKVHVAAAAFVPADDERLLRLVAGVSDGGVAVWSRSPRPHDGGGESGSSSGGWALDRAFSVGSSLTCMAIDGAGRHLVVGADGAQPSVWDLTAGVKLWQAKGGRPNALRLVDLPHTTALAALPPSAPEAVEAARASSGADAGVGADLRLRFVAGSAQAKLLLYETAAGRRPQREVALSGDAAATTRVTALVAEPSGGRVWAADGTGRVQALDVAAGRLADALKGAGGSVRALALLPPGLQQQQQQQPAAVAPSSKTPPPPLLLASAGLDRFVRVHDARTRAALGRAYLKQQLTGVCWLPVAAPAGKAGASAAGAAEEEPGAAAGQKRGRGGDDGDDGQQQQGEELAAADKQQPQQQIKKEKKKKTKKA